MKRIGILASHNGSGLDALYQGINHKLIDAEISLVISNNSDAQVLQKAHQYNIDSFVINQSKYDLPDEKIFELFTKYQCDYIFLSGYMKKLSSGLTNHFTIINSHPALLPKYGGKGMYGRYVHEAVIKNKEIKSGATIHYVNEEYDQGEFILQKELPIALNETPESLEVKIKSLEKKAIIEAFKKLLPPR
jgi:phosphoribosylglycinamide formyltransferase 1